LVLFSQKRTKLGKEEVFCCLFFAHKRASIKKNTKTKDTKRRLRERKRDERETKNPKIFWTPTDFQGSSETHLTDL
jgi:hypothetical protein